MAYLAASILALSMLSVSAAFAQSTTLLDDSTAADLAHTISLQAASMRIPEADSSKRTPAKAMQHQVDEMAAVASLLESEIRDGRGKHETRRLYHRLRAARLKAMELAIYQGVEVDSGDRMFFEQMMASLADYYGE